MSSPNVLRHNHSLEDRLGLSSAAGNLGIIAIIAISCFVTGRLALQLAATGPAMSAVWLPAGISLAAILLRGNRMWPGIFIGAFLANVMAGVHIPFSMGIAACNTLEALLAGYFVNKFAHGISAFNNPKDCLRFIFFAGMFTTALCATLGACILCMDGFGSGTEFGPLWGVWWFGDMLGILLLTPFLVLLLGHKHHSLSLIEFFEVTALLAGLSFACVLNFGPPLVSWIPRSGLYYLCVPFVVWSAIRFCPLEASGTALVLGGFTMWGSLHGYGLFAHAIGAPLIGAGYVAVIAATSSVIAATIAQQKKDLEDVLGAYYGLSEKYERESRCWEIRLNLMSPDKQKRVLRVSLSTCYGWSLTNRLKVGGKLNGGWLHFLI